MADIWFMTTVLSEGADVLRRSWLHSGLEWLWYLKPVGAPFREPTAEESQPKSGGYVALPRQKKIRGPIRMSLIFVQGEACVAGEIRLTWCLY